MDKIKRFARYYKPHLGLFLLDIGCATLVAAVDVAFPLLTNYLLKKLFPAIEQTGSSHLITLFAIMIGAIFAAYLIRQP